MFWPDFNGKDMTQRRIIIVGFMGSGKSTVARAFADRLGSRMIDLDEEIARETGRSVQEIIVKDGEPAFRKIETDVLRKVLAGNVATVIALGGGAWAVPVNRKLIEQQGALSVWLDAPFDLCWQRILTSGDTRPMARTQSRARDLYEKRRAAYSLANLRLEVTPEKIADQLADELVEALTNRSDAKSVK